ncbi:helix-turn-helix domain-containing protein [Aquimarina hainanensis]|uniref:Helix-turn-helix domain-containing protein n=1 Tax=Aquimarina hainanensis TaxID=1578017 RepID=A0ABW5N4L8_9FLAO
MNPLLKYRKKRNLTQEELAEKANVSVRTIQRIEKGTVPKGHTLRILAQTLEISESNLLEHEAEVINYETVKRINLSSLLGVIFPPINILLPWILIKYLKQENKVTKQIISIQILYTIIAIVCIGLSPFISKWFGLTRQLILISMLISVLTNIFIIIRNTISLDRNKKLYISLNFSLI